MGQIVMIDEEELADLRCKSRWFNEYCKYIQGIEKCYPDVSCWLEDGTVARCNIEILKRVIYDLNWYRRKVLKEYE